MSRCHGRKISGSRQTVVQQIWQKKSENIYIYDFPAHDCAEEQNVNPQFSSIIDNANDRLCQEEIQKFCYNGNVTLHFSSLLYMWNTSWKVCEDGIQLGSELLNPK